MALKGQRYVQLTSAPASGPWGAKLPPPSAWRPFTPITIHSYSHAQGNLYFWAAQDRSPSARISTASRLCISATHLPPGTSERLPQSSPVTILSYTSLLCVLCGADQPGAPLDPARPLPRRPSPPRLRRPLLLSRRPRLVPPPPPPPLPRLRREECPPPRRACAGASRRDRAPLHTGAISPRSRTTSRDLGVISTRPRLISQACGATTPHAPLPPPCLHTYTCLA